MSFLLSQPGKSACHFMFDCSSKSGGFLCTTPACCQHTIYITVAGCQRNEIPHLELQVINCQGNHLHRRAPKKKKPQWRKGSSTRRREKRKSQTEGACARDLRALIPQKNEKCNGVIQRSYSLVDISVIRSAGDNMRIYSSSCVRQF